MQDPRPLSNLVQRTRECRIISRRPDPRNLKTFESFEKDEGFPGRVDIRMIAGDFPILLAAILHPVPNPIDSRHGRREIGDPSHFDQGRGRGDVGGALEISHRLPEAKVSGVGPRFLKNPGRLFGSAARPFTKSESGSRWPTMGSMVAMEKPWPRLFPQHLDDGLKNRSRNLVVTHGDVDRLQTGGPR